MARSKRPAPRKAARSLPSTYEIQDDVIWPSDLLLPDRPPALVYLDMFAYINLADAAAGRPQPGYDELLYACRDCRADGKALFPLSSTHVMELLDVGDIERRKARAAMMEELSGFNYLIGRPQIQQLEIEAALNKIAGLNIAPQGPIPLIGPSLLWAFGRRGGLLTNAPGPDALAEHLCRALGIEPGADAIDSLNRWAERQLLTGPEDESDPELLSSGYDPDKWRDMLEHRAEFERDLVQQLDADPRLRQGRLRDVVNAREMANELEEVLGRPAAAMNTSIGKLLQVEDLSEQEQRAKFRDFADRMPSTRVAVSLKAAYHKDNRHVWTQNDIHDIDALAIAVPYCDAVFTDRAARNGVQRSSELDIFGTFLPRRPQQLAQWLNNRPSSA
jgi:hypothetical protein